MKEHFTLSHGATFLGRLEIFSKDGRARSWATFKGPSRAESFHPDHDYDPIESEFTGDFLNSTWVPSTWDADHVLSLQQDMESYLRTLVEVLAYASPHLERIYSFTAARWESGQDDVVGVGGLDEVPTAAEQGSLIPVAVTLKADFLAELRTNFVAAAFEAISPWADDRGEENLTSSA